jgi:hypothetical protein
MGKIKANKKTLIRWKVYIDRARMYIGYIQFFMIGFVFFESFRDTGVGNLIFNNLYISLPILVFLFFALSLVIGRMDTKLGLREEELRNLSSSNPVLREIHSNIEEIKNELKEIKSQKGIDKC